MADSDDPFYVDQTSTPVTFPYQPGAFQSYSYNGRFLCQFSGRIVRILDLHHEKEKSLEVGFSRMMEKLNVPYQWLFEICGVILRGHDSIVFVQSASKVHVAIVNLDFEISTKKVQTFLSDDTRLQSNCGIRCYTNKEVTEFGYCAKTLDEGTPFYQSVRRTVGGQLEWAGRVELPARFKLTGVFDGFVYGFPYTDEGKIEVTTLIKISVKSSERTLLEVEKNSMDDEGSFTACQWVGRVLIMARKYYERQTTHFFSMSLDSLKWQQLGLRVRGQWIELISNNDNYLVVRTEKPKSNRQTDCFYRLTFNYPHTLFNLSWIMIRSHANKVPNFYEYVLSQLPKNVTSRCPFDLAAQ